MPEIIKYRSNKITIILSATITLEQYILKILDFLINLVLENQMSKFITIFE